VVAFRQFVDPPRFTPSPFGLTSVVDMPDGTGLHWDGGIIYQPNCAAGSGSGSTYDECLAITGVGGGAVPPPAAFVGTVSTQARIATPFTVMQEFDCSAAVSMAEAELQVRGAFASSEDWLLERSFWTGIAGGQTVVFPHLAASTNLVDQTSSAPYSVLVQSAAVTVSGVGDTLKSPPEVLGLLEGALADCYGGIGIIHIPQVAYPSFDAWGLIHAQGPRLYTGNGNKVAVGAGYSGSSPAGVARAVDTAWVYATGNIICYRSDAPMVRASGAQTVDRTKNTVKVIAERRYCLGWDCCHFAVQAALGVPKGT
jgi:hypothetical protein